MYSYTYFAVFLVIKSTKFAASFANCITYTFSAVVIKFIAEFDLRNILTGNW